MPRRLATSNSQDLVQSEREIRARVRDQPLDSYRAGNVVRNHPEQKVLADGRLVLVGLEPIERLFPAFTMVEAFVSAALNERKKTQPSALLRKIIRLVEG